MHLSAYNRMMIIGNNGSGKSVLAKELAAITGLPLVHLDMEFWKPNWEQPTKAEWAARQKELAAAEKWIIEGNHTGTMEIRFQRADLILFLDVNRLVCLSSVLRRTRGKHMGMPAYLETKYDKAFFQLCKGLWDFPKTRKRTMLQLHEKYAETPFLVIKGRKNINRMLKKWRKEQAR